jgi:hypothetical protein
VERCIRCRHYDRAKSKASDHSALRWGQCRRSAPLLSPVKAKASMIEGVWPTVRDDDWCGEWTAAPRPAPRGPAIAFPDILLAGAPMPEAEPPPAASPPGRSATPANDMLAALAAEMAASGDY